MTLSKAERQFHRRTAVNCFNKAWDLLDKKGRTSDEDREMLLLGHASRYHWGLVGKPENRAVGDWQLARIYGELGQGSQALLFARASLSTCRTNNLKEILHTAYEGVARAYAVTGDSKNAKYFLGRARRHLSRLQLDKEDRKVYSDQVLDTQRMIDRL